MPKRNPWKWLAYPAIVLGVVVIGGVSAMATFTRAYNVPADSMRPNLPLGDFMLARRGYYTEQPPERGEIAVFLHKGTVFVKRVIGLPGDTIAMKAGRLWINGAEIPRQEDGTETGAYGQALKRYRETLPNGVSYPIVEIDDSSMFDEVPSIPVPADFYFVMGDNRDNSNDSRVPDFGMVARQDFTDRPFFIYFSEDRRRIGTRIN